MKIEEAIRRIKVISKGLNTENSIEYHMAIDTVLSEIDRLQKEVKLLSQPYDKLVAENTELESKIYELQQENEEFKRRLKND